MLRFKRRVNFLCSYDGPLLDEKALFRAAEGGLSSHEYVELCRWLATRLKPLCGLEESITSGPGETNSEHARARAGWTLTRRLAKNVECVTELVVSHGLVNKLDSFRIPANRSRTRTFAPFCNS